MPRKNEIITLEITDITHEGSGVGHLDGMAVFVPESAVGDQLSVRLVKVNKTHCFGKIEQIITPSPDRIKSDCTVSKRCGGCVFRHVTYDAELRYKQQFVQSNLRRIGKFELELEPIVPSPQQDGYRNKAQYPVRIQKNGLCAGFFAPRTHEVIDCHDCKLQPASFQNILETALDFVREYNISIYDETTGNGLLRHVYLRQGQRSGELMVCLVVNGSSIPHTKKLVESLLCRHAEIVSILLNENTRNTNVILGSKTHVLYGKPFISDTLCDVKFDISPLAFYQVNSLGAEQLYSIAADYAALTGNETVIDLYCGAGTIGLSLAHRCKEVIGVEIIPQAIENAKENASKNDIKNARFFCSDATEASARMAREGTCPDVVILDPPRKGCELSVLESVVKMNPQRIVMISCNSATLARDCAALAERGYTPQRCRAVDMFPRTAHVETIIMMTKCGSEGKK
ncbi:23S rRNA (uracil(1939)-C(5))-methyltransferase RlmD [Oscillospiraceae bacterium PP1C4]